MTDWLNPDPIRPDGTDEIFPSAEYVAGYDAGFEDAERLRPSVPLLQATAFGLGIVLGMVIATVFFLAAAASRPGPNPTAPSPASDMAGLALVSTVPAASSSGSGQSGAPHAAMGATSGAASSSAAGDPRVSQPTIQRASARAAHAIASEPASHA
jgi:hypothetical protein